MAVNPARKMVNTEQETVYVDGHSLKQVAAMISKYIETYGEDATLDYCQYQYEDGKYLALFSQVPESDEQLAARIAQEAVWAEREAANKRATYERLKKEFGE